MKEFDGKKKRPKGKELQNKAKDGHRKKTESLLLQMSEENKTQLMCGCCPSGIFLDANYLRSIFSFGTV
jgi:hypothetical protein